jgi:hypothetical protein
MRRRKHQRIACLALVLYVGLLVFLGSLPFIWLAQGRLTGETFDNVLAISLLLILGVAALLAIVALAVRLARSKDDDTEN